ncbi:MAG: tetratricopeptide repeat protein [Gammaproteobacteria bacterium]|nr:tetratricopeptide repeat protein [Gammaproteobacteria bacterium]MDH4314912.1 tetratricopeptide repeat protein [Gammaproteobacteria bacterium]MDH5214356.1 tetratricopeptide repeat protein [Gammaproteobacteria bacterium]MDH5621568.1 tetratricopeptide repeat protein [Gammaproteobacteria bacterium]
MTEKGTGHRWEQVEDLFHEALLQPPQERATFVAAACGGNESLRLEVEAMLAADESEDGVLDRSLASLDVGTDPAPMADGQIVGSWRILSELGRGGMGIVYLAERADGTYEQQVALKVIRGGVFAADMEPHFVRERRILGRLQHPSIARLIDAGATADGMPFLVMELVHGEPITDWCRNNKLGIRERLQLMLQVCDALQHAHRNLVVHRDLKPGNILVTGDGNVRLLDFGVARLLAGPDDDQQILTRAGFFHLTPEYAAPEQISGEAITTATDIFALGAVLYELSTNNRPRENVAGSPSAVLRAMEQPIGLPSKAPELAANWRSQLQGDIDAIVRKATAPDASRRYASVAALAEDIRRYLAHEPVMARPESVAYRSGKFIRRHRVGVAAMLAIAIAVAGGITATAWQAGEAAAQAKKAEAVKEFVLSLFAGVDPAQALGEELTARQLVDSGATRIQSELVNEPVVRAEVLTFLADMYDKMDQDDRAIELVGDALALIEGPQSTELSEALLVQGRILVGRSEDEAGIDSLQRALPMFEDRDEYLQSAEAMDLIAIARSRQGDIAESVRLTENALKLRIAALGEDNKEVAASYNNLGVLARTQGNYAVARENYERALDIRRRVLPADHPQIAISLNNLGALFYAEGDYARAADYFSESLEINGRVNGTAHHDTIAALNNLGFMQMRLGRIAEAERSLTEVYNYWLEQGKADHPNALVTRVNIATVHRTAGDFEGALAEYRAVEPLIVEKLGPDHPIVAATLHHQARSLLELGEVDAATPLLERALAIRDEVLGAEHPDSAEIIRDQGLIALLEGDFQLARERTDRALEMQRSKLPITHPTLSMSMIQLGRVALAEGEIPQALQLQKEAVERLASLLPADNPERSEAQFEFGRSLLAEGNTIDAVMQFKAARSVLVSRFGDGSWQVSKVDICLAAALEMQGRQDDALALREIAMSHIEAQLEDSHPLRRQLRDGQLL